MGRLATSPGKRYLRYMRGAFEDVYRASGWSLAMVEACTIGLRAAMLAQGFSQKEIHVNRLDNPFMHDHARQTIIADMRRVVDSKRRGIERYRSYSRRIA